MNSPLDDGHPVDCDCVGVQMLRAEKHQADPAQVKQLHLVIVSPVQLDNCYLVQKIGTKNNLDTG